MKCYITSGNMKVFGRAIHSLARIGDELYIEPSSSGVSFRTVNSSKSAFATFTFASSFFSQFDILNPNQQLSPQDVDKGKCKIALKAFLNAFKSLQNLEKSVERCKLWIVVDESKLVVQLNCRHGIVKTYHLPFIECETLQAIYDKDSCANKIVVPSKMLNEVLSNFQSNLEEVSMALFPDKMTLRNCVDDEPDISKVIQTVLTLERSEFDGYVIPVECDVTFCLKELRAVLWFAENLSLPIMVNFSTPGNPIIFIVDNTPMFEANFVLATHVPNTNSQQLNGNSENDVENRSMNVVSSVSDSDCAANVSTLKNNGVPAMEQTLMSRVSVIPKNCTHATESAEKLPPSLQPHMSLSAVEPEMMLEDELDDVIPGTPPQKRTKMLLHRCFEATFNPHTMIPGFDDVLVGDSDDED